MSMLRRLMVILVTFLSLSAPATAQQQPPGSPEIIVPGYRYAEPSFQEQQEYHRQEHERLRRKYGPADLPRGRLEDRTETPDPDIFKGAIAGPGALPQPGSQIIQGRPVSRGPRGQPLGRF